MKILVDKLPKSCAKCLFYGFKMKHVGDDVPITFNSETCILCKTRVPFDVANKIRLTTCPLSTNYRRLTYSK